MSKTRRPPDILRKSHAHADVDERARGKRELLDALDDAMDEVPDEEADAGGDGEPADTSESAGEPDRPAEDEPSA
jgi:hypothetical protein